MLSIGKIRMMVILEIHLTLPIAVILHSVLWVQYVTTEVGSVMENVEERESYINTILIVIALHQDNTNIKIVPRGQLVLGEVVEMM